MQAPVDWKSLIYLQSPLLGLLLGAVLCFYGVKKNRANVLLGISFFLISHAVFVVWLITTGVFEMFPSLYRTGNLAALIYIPLMYIYIRSAAGGKSMRWWDLLHLLPVLVYVVDFWPVFLADNSAKLELIRAEISDPALFASYSQSRFFPDGFYSPMRTLLLAGYWIRSCYQVWIAERSGSATSYTKHWLAWVKLFLGLELMMFLPFSLIFWMIDPLTSFELLHVSALGLNLGTAVSILFFPNILYGIDPRYIEDTDGKAPPKSEIQESLPAEKLEEIERSLGLSLDLHKRYLQKGYTIHNLAEDTGIPVYLLTIYINKTLKTGFSDLINRRRVEESLHFLESGKFDHLSLEGLGEQVGFNNRNSFTVAFKKYHGVNPSKYRKQVEKKSDEI